MPERSGIDSLCSDCEMAILIAGCHSYEGVVIMKGGRYIYKSVCGVRACLVAGYMLLASCIVHVHQSMGEGIDPNHSLSRRHFGTAIIKLC